MTADRRGGDHPGGPNDESSGATERSEDAGETRLRGADAALVDRSLAANDPFPGGRGFAGRIADSPEFDSPILVRDVLGREPLFVEREARPPTDPGAWSFDRRDLSEPEALPAGTIATTERSLTGWTLPDPDPAPPDEAQAAVDEAVRAATADVDDSGLAVAFSGGVDSGIVASAVPGAPCYVAGFEGCHDLAAARDAADEMALDLRVVELTHDDVVRAIPEIAAATGRQNAMDLNIAVPLYLAAEAAAADGFDRLAVGQGADELFGGYSKVVEPAEDHRVEADTVRGARMETVRTLPAQLERDVLALRAAGVDPVAPLLDDRVVAAALDLPGELLATPDERKVALRRAAEGLVPESVRTADKKAVQYGTYVAREIDRLARQAGYKRRMDDHVGQYIASLIEK
ncbi:asparagine synthetase B [Halorubrum gandharaense]